MLQWIGPHQCGQHKLDLEDYLFLKKGIKVGRRRKIVVDLGDQYDQNTLYTILKNYFKKYYIKSWRGG